MPPCIYNHRVPRTASEAMRVIRLCPNVQDWGQVCMFQGKNRRTFRAFTSNRARRVSAVRRLLPTPLVVEPQTGVLAATRWRDVAGRALRRTWTAHWRRQHVEVLPLAEISKSLSPPPRPPRAVRSHRRWSWHDRLVCPAWWGPPHLRITVAGVPAFLAMN
jgi:hypothetical protein